MFYRVLTRILVPAFAVAILVYLLTGLLPKTYSSYQTLYFPLNPSGGLGALGPIAGTPSGGDAGAVTGLGGAIMYPLIGSGSQTASGIINSHSCRETVARQLDLPRRWHTNLLGATKMLGQQVVAESDKTGLLLIQVNSGSPQLCVEINHAVFAYLKQRSAELSASANSGNRRLVEQRLAAAERELSDAKARVVAVMQNSPAASVADAQKSYLDTLKALGEAKSSRDQQRARLEMMEAEYRRLAESSNVGGTVMSLTTLNPAFSELASELQRRRLQLSDAMIAFSSTSPRVYQARKAYENAEAISNQVKQRSASRAGITSPEIIRARSEMAALDSSVRASEDALRNSAKFLASSPQQYAESTIAKGDFEAALGRVSMLRQELERSTVIQERDPSRFEVIDEPFEDPAPIGPRRTLFSVVAFLATAAICFIPFLIRLVRSAEAVAQPERYEVAA